jgi:hypothetical protein
VSQQSYPSPLPGGGTAGELALTFDRARPLRLLIVPALFDEANRLRRLTVEVMRRLDAAGIDSALPDLPGCNESLQPLDAQTVATWRAAMAAAAAWFGATHVLALRGGAALVPPGLPGWHYAPAKGSAILRQMLRARIVAAREAGVNESQDELLALGLVEGLELSGHRLGPGLLADLRDLAPEPGDRITTIDQDMLGGAGLWLRAEPDESREQADALAAILAIGMKPAA